MNRKIKNIAFFTSIRSEYGVMVPLLKKIKEHPFFSLKLLVGGAHLLEEHGYTITEITKDGFEISCKLPFLDSCNDNLSLIRGMAKLQLDIGNYFAKNKPDILIVVGDRFELLPVVSVALVMGIPIAHISGGDITEGAIDNQIRHAVSKISHLHFAGTEKSRQNLLKMGEEDWRVFNVGEPSLDYILSIERIEKKDLYEELGLDILRPTIISTFHPETISKKINGSFINQIFTNLVADYPHHQFLVTSSNFDEGGNLINDELKKIAKNSNNIIFKSSLGQKKYYSLMSYADLMLGNSSSGIIEAQSFVLPVINIGSRQDGRERNPNVIDVDLNFDNIAKGIKYGLSENFKKTLNASDNLYGEGKCADNIIACFENIDINKLFLKKTIFNER